MEREGFSEEEITWQFAFRMALSVLAIGRSQSHQTKPNQTITNAKKLKRKSKLSVLSGMKNSTRHRTWLMAKKNMVLKEWYLIINYEIAPEPNSI
jgi:hypothetical protein